MSDDITCPQGDEVFGIRDGRALPSTSEVGSEDNTFQLDSCGSWEEMVDFSTDRSDNESPRGVTEFSDSSDEDVLASANSPEVEPFLAGAASNVLGMSLVTAPRFCTNVRLLERPPASEHIWIRAFREEAVVPTGPRLDDEHLAGVADASCDTSQRECEPFWPLTENNPAAVRNLESMASV